MRLKYFLIVLVTIASMLGAAACTPEMESAINALSTAADSQASSETASETTSETASDQTQNSGEGIVVDVTPMSEEELAAEPPSQSGPGAGAGSEGSQAEPEGQVEPQQQGPVVVYTDDTYNFSVAYPADFVFQTQPAEKLAQLKPTPAASFKIMNPVTASSDIVELEPADLEIRVHSVVEIQVQDSSGVESWLTSNGLLPADGSVKPTPFQTDHVSGVKVCASTMIAPGCSYFVTGTGWIYQLIPVTLEGEAMVNTFTLIP